MKVKIAQIKKALHDQNLNLINFKNERDQMLVRLNQLTPERHQSRIIDLENQIKKLEAEIIDLKYKLNRAFNAKKENNANL